ncbi:fumarylacetoacetate hydrolase family protein [Achromobacter spanius]|uniref:fumarylacetoacetate hydrolase family protein n=1 Tax=Achromobacter spanius TaxID=217203 RepID=UPI0036E18DF0
MKFLTYRIDGVQKAGVLASQSRVLSLTDAWPTEPRPTHVGDIIALGEEAISTIREMLELLDVSSSQFVVDLDDVTVLAPIPIPTKNVFCIGRNYRAHIEEGNRARGRSPGDFPKVIEVFTKPPTAVIGTGAVVSRHERLTKQLDYEVELGVVIGKSGVNISSNDAMEHIFGYTIVNDVTARDLQTAHGQWFKGKALDTSCPIGPYVVHKSAIPDPHKLHIALDVNGEKRQDSNTSDLLFRIEEIVSQLSAGLTLQAGDIIATGTPSGVGLGLEPPRFLQTGDVMKASIAELGELSNTIG